MTLILSQTKFEGIPPNEIEEDTFLDEADVSPQILQQFFSCGLTDLILKFLEFK